MNSKTSRGVMTVGSILWAASLPAHAAYGPFEHGYGIKSLGAGGIGYTSAEDSYWISGNPATAATLGARYDIGLDWVTVLPSGRIYDNAAGPDETYSSDGTRQFPIPQAGWIRPLSDQLTLGISIFSAGLGTDYTHNPYERFGGDPVGGLAMSQSGIVSALAYKPSPQQAIGISLNVSYQTLDVKGIQPFAALSENPDKFTNQGNDGAFGIGFTVGWTGELAPGLSAGLAYRSTTWTQRTDDYAGLLPDQGRLQLPAIWGGGLAYALRQGLTVAVDYQRVEYASERALGNPVSRLDQGHPMGSDNGPGFGWQDQDIYKLGLVWNLTPTLTLRGGYSHASQIVARTETLFNLLAPVVGQDHYTAGASWQSKSGWELSGYAAVLERKNIHGQQSIPDALGGGEANVKNDMYMWGVSVGRPFGDAD
ncbi:OmpP1/FadL family transporter [Sinimarinibacterium sp. CAU 1509]|uniref:OmpP1/FadL family transporter n=1 Tax=Sinimarinibacterium sp. CAU 1509 TaxID=2562283 RepID=UPI00146AC62F|nr:outer membrane protein transport protein [Sinimarinibacterium sp. CAU 1509]